MAKKAFADLKVILISVAVFFVFALVFYLFNQSENTLAGSAVEISSEIKEKLQNQLKSGTESLILSQRNIKLNQSESKDLILGIYNNFSEGLVYGIEIKTLQKEEATSDFSKHLQFTYHPGPFFLETAQAGMNLVKIKAKEPGKYLVQIIILNQNSQVAQEYARESLLVEVK